MSFLRKHKFLMATFASCLAVVLLILISIYGCSPHSKLLAKGKAWKNYPVSELLPETKAKLLEVSDYSRTTSSTYLTFPEWYIVYSSQEYANHLKHHLPSEFPYFSAISQYWWSYGAVKKITKDRFPKNSGDDLMLMVIGSSLSIEYAIKGAYENTIGRITEWTSSNEPTAEEIYAQKVAEEYVNFIPNAPWFDFSFYTSLKGLWQQTPLTGPHLIRKWERKINLSIEYGAKGLYAKLIQMGSHATYGENSTYTYAIIQLDANTTFTPNHEIKIISAITPQQLIIAIPSEQAFRDSVITLIKKPLQFVDIAGNREIMVTAIMPRTSTFSYKAGQKLFSMKILTQPQYRRIAVRIPVSALLDLLAYLQDNHFEIEHVYDY